MVYKLSKWPFENPYFHTYLTWPSGTIPSSISSSQLFPTPAEASPNRPFASGPAVANGCGTSVDLCCDAATGFTMETYGNLGGWKPMDNLWIIYGYSMDNLWIIWTISMVIFYSYPVVMTNIAMENDPCIDDFPSYKPPFIVDFPWLC